MDRWLVRFGYDGRDFAGWARQPGRRTVEGEILRAFERARRGSAPAIEVASRTDRGVSARGNALAVRSSVGGSALLRLLNGAAPEIFAWAATPVPDEFRVRRAARRVYRYYEPAVGIELEPWRRAAALFSGPVDVRSFGRGIPSERPVLREVEAVAIDRVPGGVRIEVRAPSFVWGEVRKIVAGLREHATGRLPLERLEAAARGRLRLTLPLAEPDRLVLWDVEFPIEWRHRWTGPNRHQAARDRAEADRHWAHGELLRDLRAGVG